MGDPAGPSPTERDAVTGAATTGHEWDGIKELDTPMPRWWLWTFYATIAWAAVYVVLYPAWPLVDSATRGVLGYSTRAEAEQAIAAARQAQSVHLERIAALSLEEIAADEELTRFAVAGGRSAFSVNCVQCHGSGAAGSPGYPNLNDDDWLWGGTLEDIHTTIAHGARFAGDDESRVSEMPAFGRDGILDRAQIGRVAEHMLALSGQEHDASRAGEGEQIFADNCAACHGDSGAGDHTMGAPALNDAISLYSHDRASIVAQVVRPRHGVMPAWGDRLDAVTIKQLTLFVHALGGGKASVDAPAAEKPDEAALVD
jgi:cytochrome c oxidase cbb3-type subunit 3